LWVHSSVSGRPPNSIRANLLVPRPTPTPTPPWPRFVHIYIYVYISTKLDQLESYVGRFRNWNNREKKGQSHSWNWEPTNLKDEDSSVLQSEKNGQQWQEIRRKELRIEVRSLLELPRAPIFSQSTHNTTTLLETPKCPLMHLHFCLA
jgi:hypothetical protein